MSKWSSQSVWLAVLLNSSNPQAIPPLFDLLLTFLVFDFDVTLSTCLGPPFVSPPSGLKLVLCHLHMRLPALVGNTRDCSVPIFPMPFPPSLELSNGSK